VEQDRASPVLVHHRKLARQAARQPSGHRAVDRRNTTKTGLKVRCELDQNTCPAGIKVSDAEINAVNLTSHNFRGEWNYTISPKALALER
jgi:hypothetical protein